MSKITGTGCMLTAMIAAYCAANSNNVLQSTVAAICAMGYCGEIAFAKVQKEVSGTSSFRMHLINALSTLDDVALTGGSKFECRE